MIDWQKLIRIYEDGGITDSSLIGELFRYFDEKNIIDFLKNAPMEYINLLKKDIANFDYDKEFRIFSFNWTLEDGERAVVETKRGVKIFNDHVKNML